MNADTSYSTPSPLAVACPYCFASALTPCTTLGGHKVQPHAARTAAVRSALPLGTITTGTGPVPAPRPSWGIAPPEGVVALAAWGARAIYKPGSVDLLWDRQEGAGHNASLLALTSWLDKVALPALRKGCRLSTSSDAVFDIDDGRFYLRASPKSSHGYLYIGAWVTAVVS